LREHNVIWIVYRGEDLVTTKEIPKRELREGGEGWRYLWWHIGLVTTKEIPKRELRVYWWIFPILAVMALLQQKKSQKGN
jgi:hypothetical protein